MIDSKGKLFGKVSIIDILIVLVVVAAIAGVGYKFNKSKTMTPFTKTNDLTMQFYAEEVPESAAKAIKPGDISSDFERGSVFGNVKEIKIDKSVSWAANAQGEYVASTKAGYSSVALTVEGKGIYSNSGVSFDNVQYYIGKSIILKAGNSVFYIRIADIKKKG